MRVKRKEIKAAVEEGDKSPATRSICPSSCKHVQQPKKSPQQTHSRRPSRRRSSRSNGIPISDMLPPTLYGPLEALIVLNKSRSGRDKLFRTVYYTLRLVNNLGMTKWRLAVETGVDWVRLQHTLGSFR